MTERDTRPVGLKCGHTAMTPERKEVFLKALAETGSSVHAAAKASPEAYGERPGYSSFRDERKRDPEFALRWQEARDFYNGSLRAAISKWAVTPGERPIVSGKTGEIVGYETKPPDPRLLLAALRFSDPRWNEKQTLEHTGNVDHTHSGGLVMSAITAQDVMLLSDPEERSTFARLLTKIVDAREQADNVIEHQPE